MGGKSTLHSAVLKDDTQSVSPSFDLRSWQGLTQVLKVAKEFLTEPGAYASFRNLVLQYAQQGGDAEIKKHIDAIIATFQKEELPHEPVTPKDEVKEDVGEVTTPVIQESHTSTKKSEETFVRRGRRTKPVFGMPQEERHEEPQNSIPEAVSIPEQRARTVPITKIITEKNESSIPPLEAVPVDVETLLDVPKTLEEYKARITEIKRIVHDRIGNPVSLMGSKDGNGKRYMSALLVALKATGAGSTGNAVSAMHDLEEVFSALMKEVAVLHDEPILENVIPPEEDNVVDASVPLMHEEVTSPSDVPLDGVAVPPPYPEGENKQEIQESVPEIYRQDEKIETVTPTTVDVTEEGIPNRDVPEAVDQESELEQHTNIISARDASFQDSFKKTDDVISAVVGSIHKTNQLTDPNPLASTLVSESDGYDKWSRNPRKEAEEEISKILEVEKKQSTNMLSGADESSYEQQSDLSSPRITTALNKLLQEWSVFGGSGLLGMGPDGLEHPLYIELAPLSMGEVVAGRWENANPKTLRSIKEYIDAWRHEQSVTYMMNETFEHYLRRVVQRIQKRQIR